MWEGKSESQRSQRKGEITQREGWFGDLFFGDGEGDFYRPLA
jgi:hypothetical protein